MRKTEKAPGVTISFDEKIGLFTAADGGGPCVAVGRTPEEAESMLEVLRSRWSDIRDCKREAAEPVIRRDQLE